MKTRTTLTAGAIISAAIGAFIGSLIKDLPKNLELSDIVSAFFIVTGVITLLSSVPDFIYAIICFGTFRGGVDLVSALIGVASGFILIFLHDEITVPIIAAYMIIFPLLRIFYAATKAERRDRCRRMIPKIITGVLLLAFLPVIIGIADTVFTLALQIIGWGIIALSAIFLIVFLIIIYKSPRISSKKDENTFWNE